MSLKPASPFLKAWYRWKALRLPWRRQLLAGLDLSGNTYWEFRDARSAETGRVRRIVRYPRKAHYADVTVPPAWHQWLRHTRPEPPSLDEQRYDLARQERMKILAAEADSRWAAKPSLTDAPGRQEGAQPTPTLSPTLESSGGEADGQATDTGGSRTTATKTTPGAIQEDSGDRTEDAGRAPTSGDRRESWSRMRSKDAEGPATGSAGGVNDPWKAQAKGSPGGKWQPKGWDPSAAPKR